MKIPILFFGDITDTSSIGGFHFSTQMNRSRGNRKAFTLIELLVVIAIIAILAAILSSSVGSETKNEVVSNPYVSY